MKIQLPGKRFLSRNLALKAAASVENLTNAQICDCIEVLAGIKLSNQEKRQSKIALLQILAAAVTR